MLDLKLPGHQACDNLHVPRGFFDAADFDCRRTVLCKIFRQRMQKARLQPITCALWAARRLAGQERAIRSSHDGCPAGRGAEAELLVVSAAGAISVMIFSPCY